MDKYIELYHKVYNEQLIISHKYIKKELIQHGKEYHDEYFAFNTTLKKLADIKKHLIKQLQQFEDLLKDFDNRTSKFKDEYQYIIIPKVLKPKFTEMNVVEMSFEQFLTKLATLNAYKEMSRTFHVNNGIYRKICELNRFDLFNVATYNPLLEKSELYNNLFDGTYETKPIEDCITKEDLLELKDYIELDRFNKSNENNVKRNLSQRENIKFEIDLKYKVNFRNSYNFFTNYFDEDVISQDCFESVFLEDTNSHDFVIIFTCHTNAAAYLLKRLNKSIFKNLTQTNVAKSRKFISKNGKYFSQTTLSRLAKTVELDIKDEIDDFIVELKSQSII